MVIIQHRKVVEKHGRFEEALFTKKTMFDWLQAMLQIYVMYIKNVCLINADTVRSLQDFGVNYLYS